MLKIFQARLQQYMNREIPDVQAGFRKGKGTRDQIANIHWIIKKQENSRKTSTSSSLTMLKPLTVWITTNWKILKDMGIPDHLTCLLRNLYEMDACLPGCVWNATPRSLSPLERNTGFWTQA